ncbi:hypothetical protein AS593_18615 [Caulobacter vibrioides]|nr:hypothetical protein AS593_18615 [Caulobacter vibrioides]
MLQARAEQGDAVAQMSLSLAHRYGIGGAPIDDKLADALQRKATSQRGSTPITTYIAGLNGKPGRVSTIFVPRYDVSPATAAQNAHCGAVIALGVEGESAREACGGPDSHAALRALWAGRAKE